MTNSKPIYDLEERTFQLAKRAGSDIKKLPRTTVNIEDGKHPDCTVFIAGGDEQQ